MKGILIAGGAIIAFLLIRKESTSGSPLGLTVLLTGVRLSSGAVVADFTAQNTGAAPDSISSIVGNLYLNGNLLGALQNFIPVTVPMGAITTTFSMVVPISVGGALLDIGDLITGNSGSATVFHATGLMAVNGQTIPLDAVHQIL